MQYRAPLLGRFLHGLAACLIALLWLSSARAQTTGVAFSKFFDPATIGPGSVSTLVFTIDNAENPGPVTDLAFTDNLPATVTIATPGSPVSTCGGTLAAPAGGGTITFNGGSVGAFESCEIRVDVTSSTPNVHTNVSGDLTSSAGNSGVATADLTVVTDRPGFSKGFSPPTVQLGADSTLTFTIDNTNNGSAVQNLSFTDDLPSGLVIDGPSNVATDCPVGDTGSITATPGSDTISYNSGFNFAPPPASLAAGASCSLSVDVVAGAAGQLVNRSGELFASTGGPAVSSGFAVAEIQVDADELALRKAFTNDPAFAGGTANLRFTLTNLSRGGDATNITFTDDLDATLPGLAAVPPLPTDPCGGGSTLSGTSLLALAGGNLGPGETCSFDVTVQVPASATPGAYPNTTSQVTGDLGGTPVTGAAATDDLVVDVAPELAKEFLDNPVGSGSTTTLEFTITNTSSSFSATDITFTDTFDVVLPTAASVPADGFCGAGSSATFTPLSGSGPAQLTVTGANLGSGASCTFSIDLDVANGAASGSYPNTTSEITATVDGSTRTGAPASDTLDVVAPPQLNKAFTDDPVDPGDTVTLEFTLSHDELAAGDATDIAFTDDLDATLTGLVATGLPANDVCGAGSSISGTTNLSLTGGVLAPGETCTFAVTLQVPLNAPPGPHTNTTSAVTATVDGLATTGNTASGDLQVSGLNLTKEFVGDPVLPGSTVILRFTIDNVNPDFDATDISFTDNLDDALPGLAATGLPANDVCGAGSSISGTGNLTFSGGSLTADTSCTFDVTLQVPASAASATYPNVTSDVGATMDGSALTFGNAVDNLVVDTNLLDLSKTFTDDPVSPGGTVTLEFTVSNLSGSDTIVDIAFTDDLDAALTGLASTSGTQNDVCGAGSQLSGTSLLTLTGGTLGPGASCTFSATLQVPAGVPSGTTATNTTSTITGTSGGLAVEGAPASDTLEVDLADLSKSFDGPAAAGGTAVLQFTIDNLDDSAKSSLAFTDDLDAVLPGLTAVGLPATDICGGGSQVSGTSLLNFSGGNLAPGDSCTFSVTVQVPVGAAPGSYPNTTSALTESGLQVGNPASASLSVEPPPGFGKSFAPAVVAVGDSSTLTLAIDNTAAALAATGLSVTDDLPAGMQVAATPNASTTCSGGTLTAAAGATSIGYSGGSVAAGSSCTIQVDVTTTVAGELVNTTGDLTSSLGNSGTASATLDVVSPLEITKAFAPDNVVPGDTTTLSFTIDNTDTSPATDVAFSDDLGAALAGLTTVGLPAADVCGAGSQVSGTSVVTLTGGTLPAGGTCNFDVTVQLPADAPAGDHVNTTSAVTGNIGGAAVTGNMASDTLTVPGAPVFSKAFADAVVNLDEPTTLTFTIDNSANAVAADNLAFADDLPDGMFVADPANASTTCGGTVTAAPGAGAIQFTGGSVAAGGICTVSVDVVATVRGDYVNVTESLTSTLGDSGNATAAVFAQRVGAIPVFGSAGWIALITLLALGAARSLRRMR